MARQIVGFCALKFWSPLLILFVTYLAASESVLMAKPGSACSLLCRRVGAHLPTLSIRCGLLKARAHILWMGLFLAPAKAGKAPALCHPAWVLLPPGVWTPSCGLRDYLWGVGKYGLGKERALVNALCLQPDSLPHLPQAVYLGLLPMPCSPSRSDCCN